MSQYQACKWARRTVWFTLAVVFSIGCNPLSTFSFLTQSDPVIKAEYPLVYTDGPKKGKDVVVALFITQAPGIGPVFAGSEGKIASDIAKRLPEMAKDNKPSQKITVIEPALVNKFKMNNPNWKLMHPTEWGKKLNADFVLDIHLEKMSLYQPGTLNSLYEGQAEVSVDVHDVEMGPSEPKYTYNLPFKYPKTGVRDVSSIPVNKFKQDYLEHLAMEILWKHTAHKLDSGIARD